MNVVAQPPLVGAQVSEPVKSPVGLLVKVIVASVDAKPDATRLTVMPLGPAAGVIVILGVIVVTVNVARAKSPVLPSIWIVCGPAAAVVITVKEAVT